MAVSPSRTRPTPTVAAAVAGVVLGHDIGYALAFGDARKRAAVLQSTGHGYWSFAGLTAVGASALVVLVAVVRGARRSRSGSRCPRRPLVRWVTLAPLQVGLFIVMEVVERLVAHAPVAGLAHGQMFTIGLTIQVAVAVAVAAVLRLTEGVAARIAAVLTPAATWPEAPHTWGTLQTSGGCDGCRIAARSRAPPPHPIAVRF